MRHGLLSLARSEMLITQYKEGDDTLVLSECWLFAFVRQRLAYLRLEIYTSVVVFSSFLSFFDAVFKRTSWKRENVIP